VAANRHGWAEFKIKSWRSKKKFLNFCFFAGCFVVSVNNQLLTQASYISQLNECRLSRAGSELTGLEVGPKLNYTRIPGITFWASTFTEKFRVKKIQDFA